MTTILINVVSKINNDGKGIFNVRTKFFYGHDIYNYVGSGEHCKLLMDLYDKIEYMTFSASGLLKEINYIKELSCVKEGCSDLRIFYWRPSSNFKNWYKPEETEKFLNFLEDLNDQN